MDTDIKIFDPSYSSKEIIGSDLFFDENIVFSDLDTGEYRIFVPYVGNDFYLWVTVQPGSIT